MATEGTNAPTSAPSAPSAEGGERGDRPRGQRGGGRGRGQGQGRGRGRGNADGESRRGRGGGAPRGGRGPANEAAAAPERVTTDKSKLVPKVEKTPKGDDDVEAEVCFICASPVEHNSVGPCNHRTCHICALRMRALYKNTDCAHCRTPADNVVFTDNATKHYQDFTDADIHKTDVALGIRYEKQEIWEDTVLLLRYNCPDAECDTACLGWPDLHRHVKAAHGKMICDLCSKHKKVFTHEHELFTAKELQQHMRKGDDNPGAIDQSGFKGHPLCSFCGTRFYGDDELYVHCRDTHERCHICERVNGGQPVYFLNPDALAEHYQKAANHFPCPDPECVKAKVIVYDTLMDLKAHQLEQHGNSLDKDGRRDARAVDISGFNYRSQYVPERRGGGQSARGRGRGRDPNAEPVPASSAQPLRRDEQAFHRQMAIQSAQSTTARTFGGSLTAPAAPSPARSPAPQSQMIHPPSNNASNVADEISNLNIQEASLTPQEQARALRHRSVIERAEILLQHDANKINRFRSFISSYRSGSITAKALIDSFFALFSDTSSTSIGTLIQEVADLFEDKSKAQNIRVAWNDWRAINEDYPSLPASSSMGGSSNLPGMGWASITASATGPSNTVPTKAKSSRVLKLKSSTAQSSRSEVSKSGSWGGSTSFPAASSSSSSSAVAFPALASSKPQPSSSKVTTTPWVPTPTGSAANSAPGSARPTPPSSRPVSRGPNRGQVADFPALPPAAKPQTTLFGYGRGVVRRDGWGQAPTNTYTWGQGSNDAQKASDENAEEAESAGGKKGKKGKKVLVAWG